MNDAIRLQIESQKRNFDDNRRFFDSLDLVPGATVLDIGCGPGLDCVYFKERGLVPTGVDTWPNIFQYGDKIEFLRSLSELGERQFDYVLASHVLEHFPNTFQTLANWRSLLRKNGNIIIVVPTQIPYVANDHWIMGWNVGQLAMTLVAAGFDCRESRFQRMALDQVCGWGKKREFPATRFSIQASLPFLPAGFERNVYYFPGEYLPGEVLLADGHEIVHAEPVVLEPQPATAKAVCDSQTEAQLDKLRRHATAEADRAALAEAQLADLRNSRAWRFLHLIRRARRRLAPDGSWRWACTLRTGRVVRRIGRRVLMPSRTASVSTSER